MTRHRDLTFQAMVGERVELCVDEMPKSGRIWHVVLLDDGLRLVNPTRRKLADLPEYWAQAYRLRFRFVADAVGTYGLRLELRAARRPPDEIQHITIRVHH